MDELDWGTLPAEILKIILGNLINSYDKPIECRLVNKHWFFASMSIAYNSISIGDVEQEELEEEIEDEEIDNAVEKLGIFCDLLENSTYDVGQYVKEFCSYLIEYNIDYLGWVNKLCPNLEILKLSIDSEVCNYIIMAYQQKGSRGGQALWRNLRQLDGTIPRDPDNAYYRCLYLFRNSLENMHIVTKPKNFEMDIDSDEDDDSQEGDNGEDSDEDDDSQETDSEGSYEMTEEDYNRFCIDDNDQGTEQDLHNFLRGFKKLKTLRLNDGAISSIFECDSILQHCPANLQELRLFIGEDAEPDDRGSLPPSLAHYRLAHDDNKKFDIQKLDIDEYTPKNALLEFMYMKHRFANLKELSIYRQHGIPWRPFTAMDIDVITDFIFNIPKFTLVTGVKVNMEVVKHIFNKLIKAGNFINSKFMLEIDLTHQEREGISIRNNAIWTAQIKDAPVMELLFDQVPFTQQATHADSATNLIDILKYVGPHVNILAFEAYGRDYKTDFSRSFNMNLLDTILSTCPNLHELSMSRNKYVDCQQEGKHQALERIHFKIGNEFEDGFFERLSLRVPNLKNLRITIFGFKKPMGDGFYNITDMPLTKFKELEFCMLGYGSLDDVPEKIYEEEINIKVMLTGNDDMPMVQQYYHCYTSGYQTISPINQLKLVHTCDTYCQHDDSDMIIESSANVKSRLNFQFQCASIQTFRLFTGFRYAFHG
jgi:hypothetical protein